jgi:phage tail tape-measure protein
MATLILGAAGAAIGGSIGGAVLGVSAATIGGFIGSTIGSVVDSWIVSSLAPTQRIEGPRLDSCASPPRPRAPSSRASTAACAWAAT